MKCCACRKDMVYLKDKDVYVCYWCYRTYPEGKLSVSEVVVNGKVNKPINKEEISQLLESWQRIADKIIKDHPCQKCLSFKYSFDGDYLIKICEKECQVIKQFEEVYNNLKEQCLRKLLIGEINE